MAIYKDWIKYWQQFNIADMALFTGTEHLCAFIIVAPLFILFCQMFESCRTPPASPSFLMFHIDRPIARICSSLVLYRTPRSGSLFIYLFIIYLFIFQPGGVKAMWPSLPLNQALLWRRDRNRMNSHRVSTVDDPESPILIGARGPWQQRCDSLLCHEEWWGSVPPSVAVFSWVHAIKISSPEKPLWETRYNTKVELIRAIGQWIRNINKDGRADCCTTPSKYFAKVINWGWLYWRYINVLPLWIKPCQKYRTVAITFYPDFVYDCHCFYWNSFNYRIQINVNRYLSPGVFNPRPACGPRVSFVWPGKGISQNTMR